MATAATILLGGCATGDQQGDAAPAEPGRAESVVAPDRDDEPLDVDAQIDQILETAATPKDGALAVFSAVVAPVPGYEDQPPVVPQDGEWLFGDRAIRLVLGQVDQLSEPDLAAVRDALDDPAPPPSGQRGRSARPAARATVDVARLQATAEEMVGVLGAAFGHRLQTGVTVRSVDTMIGDGFASTDPARGLLNRDTDGDPMLGSTCLIQVGPRFARANDSTMRSAMAHEVFHCFQDEVFGDPGRHPSGSTRASPPGSGSPTAPTCRSSPTGGTPTWTPTSGPWERRTTTRSACSARSTRQGSTSPGSCAARSPGVTGRTRR